MKKETQGLDPKVPVQAIALVLSFVLSYFAIDLPVEVALAVSTLIAGGAAYFAPAARVITKRKE